MDYFDPQQAGLQGLAGGYLANAGPSYSPMSTSSAFGHGLLGAQAARFGAVQSNSHAIQQEQVMRQMQEEEEVKRILSSDLPMEQKQIALERLPKGIELSSKLTAEQLARAGLDDYRNSGDIFRAMGAPAQQQLTAPPASALGAIGDPNAGVGAGPTNAAAMRSPAAQGRAGVSAVPMEVWMHRLNSPNPSVREQAKQVLAFYKPEQQREGAMMRDGFGNVVAPQLPKMVDGFNNIPDANDPSGYRAVPVGGGLGAVGQSSAMHKAGDLYAGNLYGPVTTVSTQGRPTAMTGKQQIEGATGAPLLPPWANSQMGGASPAAAPAAGSPQQSLAALNQELQNPRLTPKEYTDLLREKVRLEKLVGGPAKTVLQNESEKAEETGSAGVRVAQAKATYENAGAAQTALSTLKQMRNDLQNIDNPNKAAGFRSALGQMLNTVGFSPARVSDLVGNVSSMESLNSLSVQLAAKIQRSQDATPTERQFLMTLESMPSASRTKEGGLKILDFMEDLQKMHLDKLDAQEKWVEEKGGLSGFESAWRKDMDTRDYVWNKKPQAPAAPAAPADAPIPKDVLFRLREGFETDFGNGQTWTLKGGKAVRVR